MISFTEEWQKLPPICVLLLLWPNLIKTYRHFWINEIFQQRLWISFTPCRVTQTFTGGGWGGQRLLAGDSVYLWLLWHEPAKQSKQRGPSYVGVCELLSVTAGPGLSKNLPPLCSTAENPRWAFNPWLSWLLTLFINFVFMLSTKVHDWSKWSCAIVLCYKWPHWHSAGHAPKWNHLFDLKRRSGYDNVFFLRPQTSNGCVGVMGTIDNNASNLASQPVKSSPNPLPFHIGASLVCC